MRKLITILFICFSSGLLAQTYYVSNSINENQFPFLKTLGRKSIPYTAVTYYIAPSPTGNDANTGTAASPWLTLAHACSVVTTPGDTIYVNPGTYTETAPAMLAVGVSIKGAGLSSHIISNYKANWNQNEPSDAAIALVSATEGTNGNQEVSNILLDGNNTTANLGILVRLRSNTSIHDITVENFYINGISYFGSATNYQTMPNTYSANNTLYNFHIDNCTDTAETYVGGGNININGQQNQTIHDGTISDTSRGPGANGDNIVNNRYGKNLKIYNVNSYKPSTGSDGWNFAFEIGWGIGGTEIYNCNFYNSDCAVDIGSFAGYTPLIDSFSYTYSIHNCFFVDANPTNNGSHGKCALSIEGVLAKNVYMYNNTFKGIVQPFGVTDGTSPGTAAHDSNIVFRDNICEDMGVNQTGYYQNIIDINKSETGGSIYGVYIINNSFSLNSLVNATLVGIVNNNSANSKNIVVANNIAIRFVNGTWLRIDNTGSILDSLILRNNLLHLNSSDSPAVTGNVITHYINYGAIDADPAYSSPPYDLSLKAGSPAIGAAYSYGYGNDIGGIPYNPPVPYFITRNKKYFKKD